MKYLILALILMTSVNAFQITEIMFNPIDDNEWVEIYTITALNISNATLADNMQSDRIMCCGTCELFVPANTAFLIVKNDSTLNFTGYKFCVDDKSIGNGLGNTGDRISITNNGISTNINYTIGVAKGKSLSLVNDSWAQTEPTPGEYHPMSENDDGNDDEPVANVTHNTTNNTHDDTTTLKNASCDYENLFNLTNELNNSLVSCFSEIEICQSLVEETEGTLSDTYSELDSLNHSLALCENNLQNCQEEANVLDENLALKNSEIIDMNISLRECTLIVSHHERLMNDMNNTISEKESAINELNNSLMACLDATKEYETRLYETNQTIILMKQNILELNISMNECETQNKDKSQQLEEKDTLILMLESDILNLTNELSRFSGCRYDNPQCDQDHECIDNGCALKNGCKYDNPSCGNGFICSNNSCVKLPKVTFRTNILDKRYHLPYSEIAIDSDDDGQLECYKYTSFNWVYYSRYPKIIAKTMEGFEVHKLPKERAIIYDHNRNPIYKKTETCSIPLSSEQINEYSTRET